MTLTKGFNPNFDICLEFGEKYENEFQKIIEGKKIEVKTDRITQRSTNVFVEYESRGKESGIAKTQAEWWTINFYSKDKFCFNITLKTKDLKNIIKNNTFKKIPGGDNNTSWGYLIPISKLIDYNNYGVENENS